MFYNLDTRGHDIDVEDKSDTIKYVFFYLWDKKIISIFDTKIKSENNQ